MVSRTRSLAAELEAVFQQHSERDVLSSQRKRAGYRQRTRIS